MVEERYSSFGVGSGAKFAEGELSLLDLHNLASSAGGSIDSKSGHQELIESTINDVMVSSSG